jgi:pseudouridine kinase
MPIKKKPILCLGGANIDYKLMPSQPIILGTSNPVITETAFGGVARNVAENLANWTNEIYIQTLVGDDAIGSALLTHLQNKGVNTEYSDQLPNAETSQYYAVLNPNGELHAAYVNMGIYDNYPKNTFIEHLNHWPQNALIFIDTNFPAWTFDIISARQSEMDWQICIDPVSIAKCKKIPRDLSAIYLIKPNRDEATALTGIKIQSHHDAFKAAQILLNRGARNVVISLGDAGCVIANHHHQQIQPAFKPKQIIDVNGAGDAFFAGILYGLQQSYSLPDACEFGAAAASFTLETTKTVLSTNPVSQIRSFIKPETTKQVQYHANAI